MSGAALSITTGANDARRLQSKSTVSSQESASLDKIASKNAGVGDNANGLRHHSQARRRLPGAGGTRVADPYRQSGLNGHYKGSPVEALTGG